MINLRHKPIVAASLHLAGFGTSVASVIGSYKYMLIESQSVPMSAAFATGLAVAIFFCWEFAFNSKRIKRRIAAALIALTAAGISGQTVFEYNHHLATVELQAKSDAEAATNAAKQGASAEILKQQLDELKTASDALRTQNATDLKTIADLSARDKKGADWQASQIRKEVDKRNQQIAANSDKSTTLSTQLNTNNKPTAATVVAPVTLMMIVRAYLFEVLTVLSILFASWMRADEKEGELEQTKPIIAAIASAEMAIYKLTVALNKVESAIDAADQRTSMIMNRINKQASGIVKHIQDTTITANNQLDQHTDETNRYILDIQNNLKIAIADTQQQLQHITDNCISDVNTAAALVADNLAAIERNLHNVADQTAHTLNNTAKNCIESIERETVCGMEAFRFLGAATERAESLCLPEKIAQGREVITEFDRRIELAVSANDCLTNNTVSAKLACADLAEAIETASEQAIIAQKIAKTAVTVAATAQKIVDDNHRISRESVDDSRESVDDSRESVDDSRESVDDSRESAMNQPRTPATDKTGIKTPEITEESVIALIKDQLIATDERGNLTIESIKNVTGWGKIKINRVREIAYERGFLERSRFGKEGWLYFYSAQKSTSAEFPLVAEMA